MKQHLLICFVISFFPFLAQSQVFHGTVLDSIGNPVSGAKICTKVDYNYQDCTISDKSGSYRIYLDDGQYVTILSKNSTGKNQIMLYEFKRDPFNKKGYLTEIESVKNEKNWNVEIKTIENQSTNYIARIEGADYDNRYYYNPITKIKKDTAYLLRKNEVSKGRMGIDVGFTYAFSEHGKLPEIQNSYVQGRPVDGQLTQNSFPEPFSFGPNISNISNLNFYDSNQIFNRGSSHKTDLNIAYERNGNYFNVKFTGRNENGIFEPAKNDFYSFNFHFRKPLQKGILKFNLNSSFEKVKMPLVGNNYMNVLYGAWNSPFHFNFNETLANGSQNLASDQYNNPAYLLNFNRDRKRENTFSGGLEYTLDRNKWKYEGRLSYSLFNQNLEYGQLPMQVLEPDPHFYKRDLNEHSTHLFFKTSYKSERFGFDAMLSQQLKIFQLDKTLFSGYSTFSDFPFGANSSVLYDQNLSQSTTNFNVDLSYKFVKQDLTVENKLTQGLFLTNTNKQNVAYQFNNLFLIDTEYLLNDFYANLGVKNELLYSEPELINHKLNFNSLNQNLTNFTNYREQYELFILDKPGKLQRKFSSDIQLGIGVRHIFYLFANYYHFKVNDAYAPIFQNGGFRWMNAANYHQNGLEITLSNGGMFKSNNFKWDFSMNFHAYKNQTDKILIDQDRVPFFGFNEVSKNFVKGSPVGAIVGSDFQRDDAGNLIIGSDGFPLVDPNLKVIADPNPDFTLSFTNEFSFKKLYLSITFDWQKGGQIWNGTQNTLNYYGRSQQSADLRNTTNYIFNGVNSSGESNNIPVDFTNPMNDISENRWVRYGVTGVASEAIQSASFFRLQNISLTYKSDLRQYHSDLLSRFSISIFAQNLWVVSDYPGVFPGNGLLGNVSGAGMDYFNFPLTKMYGASVNFKF